MWPRAVESTKVNHNERASSYFCNSDRNDRSAPNALTSRFRPRRGRDQRTHNPSGSLCLSAWYTLLTRGQPFGRCRTLRSSCDGGFLGQSLPLAPLRRGPRRTPRSTLAPETWPARPVPRVRARPRRRPSRIPRRLSVTPGVHITLFAPRSRSRRGPRPADPAARRRPSARSLCRADPLVLGRPALKRSAARCCGFCSTRCSYSPRLPLRVPRHGLR